MAGTTTPTPLVTVYNTDGVAVGGTFSSIADAETYVDNNYSTLSNPGGVVTADPPVTVTVGPGTYTGQVSVTEPEVLDSSKGSGSTTIVDNVAGAYSFGVNVAASNVQIGNLTNGGFTIEAQAAGDVAVQLLGSNDTLEGNILSSSGGPGGADLVTGSGADSLTIQGNTFEGTGFALAYINGALDTYTASTNVNIVDNSFTGKATAGADIADDAASGEISGNTFKGSGTQAIFLGNVSEAVANYYNALSGTIYVPVAGTITLSGNDFSQWKGVDVSTWDANYTFANGGKGVTLTDAITSTGQEIDTVTGWTSGSKLTLDTGFDTAVGAVQNGSGVVDIYLSTGDEIILKGTNVDAGQIACLLGTQSYQSVVQAPSGVVPFTVGNEDNVLVLIESGDYVINSGVLVGVTVGNGNSDGVSAGNNDVITVGNGNNDTLTAGINSDVTLGKGDNDTVTVGYNSLVVLGNGNNDTATAGGHSVIMMGDGNRDTATAGSDGSGITLGKGNGDVATVGDNGGIVIGNGNYDRATAGVDGTIKLGNGNYDRATAGAGSTITLGNGLHDRASAGAGSTITLGGGNGDTVNVTGSSSASSATGSITIGHGTNDQINFNVAVSAAYTLTEIINGASKTDVLNFAGVTGGGTIKDVGVVSNSSSPYYHDLQITDGNDLTVYLVGVSSVTVNNITHTVTI